MQCVTAVDGLWLAELGPVFFTVKDNTLSRIVSLPINQLVLLQVSGSHNKYELLF